MLLKVIASLMPRDVNLNLDVNVDASAFASKFRAAQAMLGNLPQPKVIDHG